MVAASAVVVVAGCLAQPAPDLPASFADRLRERGWAFEVAPVPTADVRTAVDVVSGLAGSTGWGPMVRTRAVPILGILRCTGAVEPCKPGPYANPGDKPRPVWVVVYPERVGPDGDVGWILLDAVGPGLDFHDPLDPDP